MLRRNLERKLARGGCVALLIGACFGGEFAVGRPCESDVDCGPQLRCVEGYCGGLGSPPLCGNGLREEGEACDDGNMDDGDGCSSNCLLPAPALNFAQAKQFKFSWDPVFGVKYYQLLERVNPGDEFMQAGYNIEGESSSLSVPLHLRGSASYKLNACNAISCTESDVVDVTGTLAGAVGYLKASNTGQGDAFGDSLALSGDGSTLVVGAGVANIVYVFVREGNNWQQQAYFKASNTEGLDQFGLSMALSGDGNTLAVGAPWEGGNSAGINGQDNNLAEQAGAAYIFIRTGKNWSQQAYIKASNSGAHDSFGNSLALSREGNILAVGAPWESSNATGINGQDNDLAEGAGAVYIFVRVGDGWSQQVYVKGSNASEGDLFGDSVALSEDGGTLAVGAPWEDSDAKGVGGDQDNNSAEDAGAVYVFGRVGKTWSQQTYIKASNAGMYDRFGDNLALSGDGTTLVVGSPWESSSATGVNGNQGDDSAGNAGAVYVFMRTNETWAQQAYVKASNTDADDDFGNSLALSRNGSALAIGSPGEDGNATGINGQDNDSNSDVGAAYVFVRTDTGWQQRAYVKPPVSRTEGPPLEFGRVAISWDANTLIVGASGESSSAKGFNGEQFDDSSGGSGAVYVF